MKRDRLRVFIAIELPDEVKKQLAQVLVELRRLPFSVKWVEPKNLHLTLAFLGYLEKDKLAGLYRAVKKSEVGIAPFGLKLTRIISFPSFNRPRVIVLELSGEVFWLEKLQKALGENLAREGIECRIKPAHLTLGRVRAKVKKGDRAKLGKKLADFPFSFQREIFVDRLVVFKSELSSQGPVYTPLKEFRLF